MSLENSEGTVLQRLGWAKVVDREVLLENRMHTLRFIPNLTTEEKISKPQVNTIWFDIIWEQEI